MMASFLPSFLPSFLCCLGRTASPSPSKHDFYIGRSEGIPNVLEQEPRSPNAPSAPARASFAGRSFQIRGAPAKDGPSQPCVHLAVRLQA
jgi:hypothetical protein